MTDDELAAAHGISLEEVQEFKDVFKQFDADNSGTIDTQELHTVMNQMGYNPTDDELQKMMAEVDENASGSIDFSEFLALMSPKVTTDLEEDIDLSWKLFGGIDNGWLPSKEVRQVLVDFGEGITEEELTDMMAEADVDGDGEVTFEEFHKMMRTR